MEQNVGEIYRTAKKKFVVEKARNKKKGGSFWNQHIKIVCKDSHKVLKVKMAVTSSAKWATHF